MMRRGIAGALAFSLVVVPQTAWAQVQGSALQGETVSFRYAHGTRDRMMDGLAYVHPAANEATQPQPLLVFLHGVNGEGAARYWLGGGAVPDVRAMVASLIEARVIGPVVLAAPWAALGVEEPPTLWIDFDLDAFVRETIMALRGRVTIDRTRLVVAGHSGAGCNPRGGLATAMTTSEPARAYLIIDVCMRDAQGRAFGAGPAQSDVVVTWQPQWRRDVERFERRFYEVSRANKGTGLRVVDGMNMTMSGSHTLIVQAALTKWLPLWIAPDRGFLQRIGHHQPP